MSDEQHDQGNRSGGAWQSAAPSAGWYQDPWDGHRRRYWDGQRWTGDVSFEPPGSWGGQGASGGGDPAAAWAPSAQPRQDAPQPRQDAPQYQEPQPYQPAPAQHPQVQAQPQYPGAGPYWPSQGGEMQTQPGWGGGGWGQPPQVPGVWGSAPAWPPAAPAHDKGNRIHVAIVAVIAAIAVVAGIGIGSQINSSSTTAASSTGGTGGTGGTGSNGGGIGGTNPFGGSPSNGFGSGGTTGGSSTLSSAQQAIARRVDRSVVDVNTQLTYQNGAAAGTGMILSANGVILTNNHVIDGATSITVTVVSSGKSYKADVVGTDVTEDVAVLQMEGASGLTPITIGDSTGVARGDSVIALGNAGGAGGTPSAVTGTVRALNQTITASDSNGSNAEVLNGLIQTDAPIQAGDSGGPLIDAKGAVIGMDTAASSGNAISGAASVGFAIPMSNATTIATQIQQHKASDKIHIGETGFLGVSVSGTGSSLGANAPTGASVASVIPGSPADKAGIVAGDTITGVDTTTVDSSTALTASLRAHHPGDQVSVTWVSSDGTSHTATVTLAVGPAA